MSLLHVLGLVCLAHPMNLFLFNIVSKGVRWEMLAGGTWEGLLKGD